MMNNNWKEDPRLKSMDPGKIKFLTDFVERLNGTPKNQVLASFIAMSAEANQKNITFSDQETRLLTDILLSHMSSADKGRLDMFRTLTQKMTSGRG